MAYPRQSIELSAPELNQLVQSFFHKPTDSGEIVHRFESAFAAFLGVKHAVSFGSQRAGMLAALKALRQKEGEEVIVPAYTFFSVPACAVLAGFTPVFVDVDPKTWNLDPDQVKRAVTSRTRAIIVTHLNGCPADLESLVQIAKNSGITLIEDCAQALGATYHLKQVGSFGVGCFSFGEGKNLFAMGGGMITTNDDGLAAELRRDVDSSKSPGLGQIFTKTLRLLAFRTLTEPWVFSLTAFPLIYLSSLKNGKPDTDKEHAMEYLSPESLREKWVNSQATLALAQLGRLPQRNEKRRENARTLTHELGNIKGLETPPDPSDRTHLYMHYALSIGERERFCRGLIRRGIDAQRDYCSYCPGLPDFRPPGSLLPRKTPVAESLEGRIVYLPNQPQLSKTDMVRIAHALKGVLTS